MKLVVQHDPKTKTKLRFGRCTSVWPEFELFYQQGWVGVLSFTYMANVIFLQNATHR
jgi:hypothetical protein